MTRSGSCLAIRHPGALAMGFLLCGIGRAEAAESTSADRVDMSAPGRSTVPAPAFESRPRDQSRNDFSSQDMALEFRFGPYAPRVDESEGLRSPQFKDFFGDKKRFQLGLEVDWQIWRAPHLGTLGVGAGWAITRMSGANKLPAGVDNVPPQNIQQETTFTIMPMYGVGVLRVDVLSHDYGIPFVGYGKFGLAVAPWWINNGIATASSCTSDDPDTRRCIKGRDTSIGTQASLGAMLSLDWLEPSAGAELDNTMGINNTYIFFEWSVSNYPGKQMNVGSNTWVTGFAFEL
jgi:hypothetical protein